MGKYEPRDTEHLYSYAVKNGILVKRKAQKAVNIPYLQKQEVSMKKPTDDERLETLILLVDFEAIQPPQPGTALNDVVPDFETNQELYAWRKRLVDKVFDS